jgi:hypothetical protein
MDQEQVNDLHGQSLRELLLSSQQQSALLVQLTNRLEQIDQNQDQIGQALQQVAVGQPPPPPQRPIDPRTGDEIGRAVEPVKLRPIPESPKKPDNISFDGTQIDPVKRTLAWRALVRELYRRTAAYARRMADVMYANIMATPYQLLSGWTSYIDDGTRPPDPDPQTTAAEQQLAREVLDNWIQECIYRDTCVDTHEKRREFATLVKRMIENEFADIFKIL